MHSIAFSMNESDTLENRLKHYRNYLLPYAYNVIGMVEPARDIVEEVIVPFFMKKNLEVDNVTGYLVRSVVNKSISHKEKLRNKLETYPGDWLPEPVSTGGEIYDEIDKPKILNYSLLVLLEKLNPVERAVYILKNAFDFKHSDIAETLDIKEEYSRQLFKRSTDKIRLKKGKRKSLTPKDKSVLEDLIDAMASANIEDIKALLSDTVASVSDGGPDVSATRKPLFGKERVSKLLRAIGTKYQLEGTQLTYFKLNHQHGVLYSISGMPYRAMIIETDGQSVQEIYVVLNPEKLKGFFK